jgi:hypothetical protein
MLYFFSRRDGDGGAERLGRALSRFLILSFFCSAIKIIPNSKRTRAFFSHST